MPPSPSDSVNTRTLFRKACDGLWWMPVWRASAAERRHHDRCTAQRGPNLLTEGSMTLSRIGISKRDLSCASKVGVLSC